MSRFRTELTQKKAYDRLLKKINTQLAKHKLVVSGGAKVDASLTESPFSPKGKPTYELAEDRKRATDFRKRLQKNGFSMMQYSVYIRHCPSFENLTVHKQRVRRVLPPKGRMSMLHITDKQYSQMENFWGTFVNPLPPTPQQLQMF